MSGINWRRVLLGGLLAGGVTFFLEGLAGVLTMEQMVSSLAEHGLFMDFTPAGAGMAVPLVASVLGGLALVFFYALAMPRLGPGPKTAMIVATALWLGGYVLSLLGYKVMGLFPDSLLITWGLTGFVEMNLAALAGTRLYREASAEPADA